MLAPLDSAFPRQPQHLHLHKILPDFVSTFLHCCWATLPGTHFFLIYYHKNRISSTVTGVSFSAFLFLLLADTRRRRTPRGFPSLPLVILDLTSQMLLVGGGSPQTRKTTESLISFGLSLSPGCLPYSNWAPSWSYFFQDPIYSRDECKWVLILLPEHVLFAVSFRLLTFVTIQPKLQIDWNQICQQFGCAWANPGGILPKGCCCW